MTEGSIGWEERLSVQGTRDSGKTWIMKMLCCDLSNCIAGIFDCGGKTRKPPESARKCSDGDRSPEPAVSHGVAVCPEEMCRDHAQGSWVCAACLEPCRVLWSLFALSLPQASDAALDCHCWAGSHQLVSLGPLNNHQLTLILIRFGQPKSQLKGGLIWQCGDRKLLNSLLYYLSTI